MQQALMIAPSRPTTPAASRHHFGLGTVILPPGQDAWNDYLYHGGPHFPEWSSLPTLGEDYLALVRWGLKHASRWQLALS